MRKRFAFAVLTLLVTCVDGRARSSSPARAWVYDVPGGEKYASPDYEVTLVSNGRTHKSFVLHSWALDRYVRRNPDLSPKDVHNHKARATPSHSAAIFSFRGEVEVRVKVRKNAGHITLPLKSARVLPSSYNIPCTIENGDTIVFTLARPEKVVVIPNYEQAWDVFAKLAKGHVPAPSWRSTFSELEKRKSWHAARVRESLSEGYRTPLIILAHAPERDTPGRTAPGTLLIRPGDTVSQAQLYKYGTVWFTPGIHDLSGMGKTPYFQTLVKKGQTIYVEGGAYVMARFRRNEKLGKGPCSIRGRGVISGIRHEWVVSPLGASQIVNIDDLSGVTITDRACFGIYGGHRIDDIAMLGAWHGNTDGPDYLDDCVLQNSFLMAHDDNLKLNNNTRAKHVVIWQMTNAHAIMVKEMRDQVTFADSVVEDVDIVACFPPPPRWNAPWGRLSPGAISCVLGSDVEVKNFTFRDIRIESPYLCRVFSFYNLDTRKPYTPQWLARFKTSKDRHSRIRGMTFRNISVDSPVIAYPSLMGSAYDDALTNIRFANVKINGVTITEENKDRFFEIEYDKVRALSFSPR